MKLIYLQNMYKFWQKFQFIFIYFYKITANPTQIIPIRSTISRTFYIALSNVLVNNQIKLFHLCNTLPS